MSIPSKAELEAAFSHCVKRRGREVALDILKVMGGVANVADVPEKRRMLTTAALERKPPEDRSGANDNRPAQVHHALADIGKAAFARMRGDPAQ